jgi:hypothetical protein
LKAILAAVQLGFFEIDPRSGYAGVILLGAHMRKVSVATVATIVAIALYFTLFWGFDALRIWNSPALGLEDVWRSQYLFVLGSELGLAPRGLFKLAAFFGALKLAVAVICAIHLVDRLRSVTGASSEILEGGLMLVMFIAIVSTAPAIMSGNADVVYDQAIQLAFAGIGIALCIVERKYRSDKAGRSLLRIVVLAVAFAAAGVAAILVGQSQRVVTVNVQVAKSDIPMAQALAPSDME